MGLLGTIYRWRLARDWRRLMPGSWSALIPVLPLSVALVLYAMWWWYDPIPKETVVGAERVLQGDIPYRDFWTMYAPGQFYLEALLYRIFGSHLLVNHIAGSLGLIAAAYVLYLLANNLTGSKWHAVIPASVFLAAGYYSEYFKDLGSYVPAIFLIVVSLSLVVQHYKTDRPVFLLAAGLATGIAIIFKHDIGGYATIAISAGLMVHRALSESTIISRAKAMTGGLMIYGVGTAAAALPVYIYFLAVAGPDIVQDLVVFPLTDFRLVRPESFPSLLPFDIYQGLSYWTAFNLVRYLALNVPFSLFLLGLVGIVIAVAERRPDYAAIGTTLALGYLLHYSAAHVQINTNVITLSAYGALLGILFYRLVKSKIPIGRLSQVNMGIAAAVLGWVLVLSVQPLYLNWKEAQGSPAVLALPKVSGLRASSLQVQALTGLKSYVNAKVPPGQEIYVGLNRHDIIIIGRGGLHFVLDRPSATRYQELHPAIADTAPVQQEIIADLRRKNVSVIILEQIFPDETLDPIKKRFQERVPEIGATELDRFIRDNYKQVIEFGPYMVWEKATKEGV